MGKEASYQEKFASILPWSKEIIADIKKDVRGEFLRKQLSFVQKYFSKKAVDKLSIEEIANAFWAEVGEGKEEIGEWIAARWIVKHVDLYQFFAMELTKINPHFSEIELLSLDESKSLLMQAASQFGLSEIYLFSVLNSVAFPGEVFEELRQKVLSQITSQDLACQKEEVCDIAELKAKQEREIAKMTERYENKLQALTKKYFTDVEGLRKQVGQLQRKLGELVSHV